MRFFDWRTEQYAGLTESIDVMLEIESSLFHLIVWKIVFALFVAMISAAVLVLVPGDG